MAWVASQFNYFGRVTILGASYCSNYSPCSYETVKTVYREKDVTVLWHLESKSRQRSH